MANQEEDALKENTISYLVENGYDQELDIDNMEIVNIGQNETMHAVVVTFTDDPKVDYFYTYKKDTNQITQIDVVNKGSGQPLKHREF